MSSYLLVLSNFRKREAESRAAAARAAANQASGVQRSLASADAGGDAVLAAAAQQEPIAAELDGANRG